MFPEPSRDHTFLPPFSTERIEIPPCSGQNTAVQRSTPNHFFEWLSHDEITPDTLQRVPELFLRCPITSHRGRSPIPEHNHRVAESINTIRQEADFCHSASENFAFHEAESTFRALFTGAGNLFTVRTYPDRKRPCSDSSNQIKHVDCNLTLYSHAVLTIDLSRLLFARASEKLISETEIHLTARLSKSGALHRKQKSKTNS